MKHRKVLMLVVVLAYVGSVLAVAHADTSTDATIAGINAGTALKTGGIGALTGVLLSVMTVINKNHNAPGSEKIDPRKLAINLVVGLGIGVALPALGFDVTQLKGDSQIVTLAVAGVNYLFLHGLNLTVRPMFGKWFTGQKATEPTK